MSKLLIANEEADTSVDEMSDDQLNAEVSNNNADSQQINALSDQLSETDGIAQAVDDTVQALGSSEVSEETQKALAPALEYFRIRLGSNTPIISMESRDVASIQQELNSFKERLEKSRSVAQESFSGKVSTWFERTFRSNKAIFKKMDEAIDALETRGPRVDNFEPDWVGDDVFRLIGKRDVNASDVSHLAGIFSKEADALLPSVRETAKLLNDITNMISRKLFVSEKGAGEKIQGISNKIYENGIKIEEEFKRIFDKKLTTAVSVRLKPLSKDEAKKLADVASKIVKSYDIRSVYNEYCEAWGSLEAAIFQAQQTRLIGVFAEDLRNARKAINKANGIFEGRLQYLANAETHYYYSIYRYIKESVM